MNSGRPTVSSGLSTDTHKVLTSGMYYLSAQTTVLQGSGLVITLSQTGSTSASIATPATSPLQEMVSINKTFNCVAGDILTVTITSSATADQPPSMIKTIINLRAGSN